MSEAELILPTMRGGCVRTGNKVHTLFRVTSAPRKLAADCSARNGDRQGTTNSDECSEIRR